MSTSGLKSTGMTRQEAMSQNKDQPELHANHWQLIAGSPSAQSHFSILLSFAPLHWVLGFLHRLSAWKGDTKAASVMYLFRWVFLRRGSDEASKQ
eukprot:scaffold107948_cov20-Tisochrysis_lutea.AAC.1